MKPRRGHGAGSVIVRRSGTRAGEILVQVSGEDGRKRQFSRDANGRRFRNKSEADTFLRTLLDNAEQSVIAASKKTVSEFLDEWLRVVIRPHRKPKTYEEYERTVRLHLKPALGAEQLRRLKNKTVQEFVNAELADGRSEHHARKCVSVLHVALEQAVKWSEIRTNPADHLSMPPEGERTIHVLDVDQAMRLLDRSRDHPFYPLIAAALYLGLRRGEILGMQLADLDLDARTYRVRGNLQRIEKQYLVVGPKSAAGRREIALPNALVSILRARIARRELDRRKAEEWQENDLLFCRHDGSPMRLALVNREFRRLLAAAGIDVPAGVGWHLLRHTHASLLDGSNASIATIQASLGHSSRAMTERYIHALESQKRAVADAMDRLAERFADDRADRSDKNADSERESG